MLLILPVGWAACGGGASSPSGGSSVSGLRFTSDTVVGHSHDFTIAMVDLTTPPGGGESGSTTLVSGHMHTVSLSQAELTQIEAGQTVTKETSTAQAHLHTFQFVLGAGVETAGSGGSSGTTGSGGSSGTAGTSGAAGTSGTGTAGVYGTT